METEQLADALLGLGPLPQALQDRGFQERLRAYLREVAAISPYAQRQLLLSAGQVAEQLYFVARGFARGYCYDDRSGRPLTLYLWDAQALATPLQSLLLRQPTELYLEVMPGSVLVSLSYRHLMDMVAQLPGSEVLLRLLVLHYSAFHKERIFDLLTRPAWERYVRLLQSHPQVEQQVSKEAIASYLGITPQSLSRLLRENGHP